MTKTEAMIMAKAQKDLAETINRLAQDGPTWNRFLTRMPRYRYFYIKGCKDEFFWTTETVRHNGKPRYVSGIYRYIKTRKTLKLTNERYHAKRQDAKARALKLKQEATS